MPLISLSRTGQLKHHFMPKGKAIEDKRAKGDILFGFLYISLSSSHLGIPQIILYALTCLYFFEWRLVWLFRVNGWESHEKCGRSYFSAF